MGRRSRRMACAALVAAVLLLPAVWFAAGRGRAPQAPAAPAAPTAPTPVPATATTPDGAVRLSVSAQAGTASLGQPYELAGTGWVPGAPVTVATVNEPGTVARYAWTVADAQGAFRVAVVLTEPGVWTHRVYWQPDPAAPPRDERARLQVRAH